MADSQRCPSCNEEYDLDTKPLTDSCGHARCFLCTFSDGMCPLCTGSHEPKSDIVHNPSVEVNISDASDTVSQIGDSIAAGKCGVQGDQCLEERVTSATNKQIAQHQPMVDENSPAKAVDDVDGQDGPNNDHYCDVMMTAHVEMDKTVDRVLADVREPCEDEQFNGVRTQSTGMEDDHQISESDGVPDSGEVKTEKDANHSMQCDDGKQTRNEGDESVQTNPKFGRAVVTRKSLNRNYKCSACGELLKTIVMARKHVKLHMFSRRDFGCDLCGATFQKPIDYVQHMYAGMCEQDGDVSDEEEAVIRGEGPSSETKTKYHVCKYCGDVFMGIQTLNRHIKSIHGEKAEFKCQRCEKTFENRSKLLRHIKATQNRGKCPTRPPRCKENSDIHCPVCQKKFGTNWNLTIHMRQHSGDKPFKCYKCDKAYIRKRSLKEHHQRAHSDIKPIRCEVCGKGFIRKTHLRRHMVRHGEKKYQCICGMRFRRLEKLTAHTKRPNSSFPHVATVTGNSRHNTRNSRTHTGDRPYRCPVCDKSFSVRRAMMKHTRVVHSKERKFECQVCGKRFKEKGTMNRHVRKIHNSI